MDSLKALDPERPIREADICAAKSHARFTPESRHQMVRERLFPGGRGSRPGNVRCTSALNAIGEISVGPAAL